MRVSIARRRVGKDVAWQEQYGKAERKQRFTALCNTLLQRRVIGCRERDKRKRSPSTQEQVCFTAACVAVFL